MLEMFVLLPLALLALAIVGVFLVAGSIIWFLVELPFKLLGWVLGAIFFAVFLLPVVLMLALVAVAVAAVLFFPILPLIVLAGMVWLVMRLVRTRRTQALR
jgi:hypothetical protein